MCAVVLSFPYTVPEFLPRVVTKVASHLGDPAIIADAARSCLTEFRRTHQDTWDDIEDQFTADEWEAVNDVLVSPYYYA